MATPVRQSEDKETRNVLDIIGLDELGKCLESYTQVFTSLFSGAGASYIYLNNFVHVEGEGGNQEQGGKISSWRVAIVAVVGIAMLMLPVILLLSVRRARKEMWVRKALQGLDQRLLESQQVQGEAAQDSGEAA